MQSLLGLTGGFVCTGMRWSVEPVWGKFIVYWRPCLRQGQDRNLTTRFPSVVVHVHALTWSIHELLLEDGKGTVLTVPKNGISIIFWSR
ncbi:MAG: hypothetical protein ACRD3T_18955, partial [Terriglobia bacterium]